MPKEPKTIFAFSIVMLLLFIAGMPEMGFGRTDKSLELNIPKLAIPIAKPSKAQVKAQAKSNSKIDSASASHISDSSETIKAISNSPMNNNFISVKHMVGRSTLTFNWKNRVASAVFTRGQQIWVVFNKKSKVDVKKLKPLLPSFIDNVNIIPSKNHTILRLKSNVPIYAKAQKLNKNNDWHITLSRRNKTPKTPINTSIITKSRIAPHVLISIFETAKPFQVKDPDVGDNLTIIPLYPQDAGIFPARIFTDFKIIQSAQGITIEKYRDELEITKLQNGIRISAKDETTLSDNIPDMNIKELINNENSSGTLFPYQIWKAKDPIDLRKKEQKLVRKISKADYNKSMLLRLDMAKLLLAEGYHSEAIGILNIIRRLDKGFYREYQLAALRGAANLMIYRTQEAESDFSSQSIANEEEMQVWRAITSILLGKQAPIYNHMQFDRLYARHYPPAMRQRLATIAIDRAISLGKLNIAQNILDKLYEQNVFANKPDYVDYIIGRLLVAKDDLPKSIAVLEDILDRTNDRFIHAHADFTLATAVYNSGEMVKDNFINRLELIRIRWRGDQLEINLLNTLGELYVSQGKYLEGLRAWKEIISYYPFTEGAAQIASRMAETFIKLFNEGIADKMKPLNALALYYEFRELTPIGYAGDLMVQNLADRLARVDLLDRAAALLEHQVKHKLDGEERSKVGVRLALLYLLNRQPEKTIEALELTGYGNNDIELDNKRRYLAARAYSKTGQTDLAFNILEDDYSIEAKQIRLDIYWENKDWLHLIPTAEDIISSRKDITATLTNTEVQTLLRLAIAYTFENDTLQLQYLRDYFTPLMANHPLKDSFLYITNDSGIITPDNVATIANDINQIEDFLSTYRNKIKRDGISSVFE